MKEARQYWRIVKCYVRNATGENREIKIDKYSWKNAYKDSWEIAASKEKKNKSINEEETSFEVLEFGLGAGSTAFIKGNAQDNKLSKGDADLYVTDKDCYIEVTRKRFPATNHTVLATKPVTFMVNWQHKVC